jgi:hypothetical protein
MTFNYRKLFLLLSIFIHLEISVAHTNSVGYTSSGAGTVTFWYGTYHGCGTVSAEGSFNVIGINGNTYPSTTASFTTLTCVQPSGLVPGVNYFNANNAGLVPYDVTQPNGQSLVWQGATFTGIAPGDYQFTYIPSATPSTTWTPLFPPFQNPTALRLTKAGLGITASPTSRPINKQSASPMKSKKKSKSKADPKAEPKGIKKGKSKGKKGKR